MAQPQMFQVKTSGFEMTLIKLSNTRVALKTAARAGLTAAGKVIYRHVKKRAGLRDHTLADLAKKPRPDHPYAKRHGRIKIHTRIPWQVHIQKSGEDPNEYLHKALKGVYHEDGAGMHYDIWVDLNIAPHAEYVIQGTKVMFARDFIWNAAIEKRDDPKVMQAVVKALGKGLRSKVGVRFGSGTPTLGGGGGGLGAAYGVR